jgi:hypothetical protein
MLKTHGKSLLAGLMPGFDEYKPKPTEELSQKAITIYLNLNNWVIKYIFHDANFLTWEVLEGTQEKGTSDSENYESFSLAPGIFLIDFVKRSKPEQCITMTLDLNAMKATVAITDIVREEGDQYLCQHDFVHAEIDKAGSNGDIIPHERTTDLIGKRIMWTYSCIHKYEHIYLNDCLFTWHCLGGPEKGVADTNGCVCFRLAPDVYLFSWWEKLLPCRAVMIFNLKEMRSAGSFFGGNPETKQIVHCTVGAYGKLLNVTTYD